MPVNQKPQTDHSSVYRNHYGAPSRRTVMQGAAWSVPVIAASIAAPAAAASTGPLRLTFSQSEYSGSLCGITGISVSATENDQPHAGATVIVTCPEPYHFPDGRRTFTGVTTVAGVVKVPTLLADGAGDGVLSATIGASQAHCTVHATEQLSLLQAAGATASALDVPAGTVGIGGGYSITPAGSLLLNGRAIAEGVSAGAGYWYRGGPSANVMQNGVATYIANDAVVMTDPSVPAGSIPHVGGYFLASDGSLYFGGVIATGVSSVAGFMKDDTPNASLIANGVATLITGQELTTTYPAVPASAVAVGGEYFLAGGSMYFRNAAVAGGVSSASGYVDPGHGDTHRAAVIGQGGAAIYQEGATVQQIPAHPAGTKPQVGGYFLRPDESLFLLDAPVMSGSAAVSGVRRLWPYADPSGFHAVIETRESC